MSTGTPTIGAWAAEMGKRGGKAGIGAAKRRSPEHYKHAAAKAVESRKAKREAPEEWKAARALREQNKAARRLAAEQDRAIESERAGLATEQEMKRAAAEGRRCVALARERDQAMAEIRARKQLIADAKKKEPTKTPKPSRPMPALCECCGQPPPGRGRDKGRLLPDHCHALGVARGWLCSKCNTGLGLLGDDLPGIDRMRNYLLKYSAFASWWTA
jgi:hypothetical protein